MVHIGDDVVEDNDDHIEVPGKSLELLRVLVDEEGSLDVVNLAILLDEVLADSVDVVDNYQLQLLLVSSGSKVQEKLIVLIDVVCVGNLYTLMDQSLLRTISLSQKVFYNKSERSDLILDLLTFHFIKSLLVKRFARCDVQGTSVEPALRLG